MHADFNGVKLLSLCHSVMAMKFLKMDSDLDGWMVSDICCTKIMLVLIYYGYTIVFEQYFLFLQSLPLYVLHCKLHITQQISLIDLLCTLCSDLR